MSWHGGSGKGTGKQPTDWTQTCQCVRAVESCAGGGGRSPVFRVHILKTLWLGLSESFLLAKPRLPASPPPAPVRTI